MKSKNTLQLIGQFFLKHYSGMIVTIISGLILSYMTVKITNVINASELREQRINSKVETTEFKESQEKQNNTIESKLSKEQAELIIEPIQKSIANFTATLNKLIDMHLHASIERKQIKLESIIPKDSFTLYVSSQKIIAVKDTQNIALATKPRKFLFFNFN